MEKLTGTIYWFRGNLKQIKGDYTTTAQVTVIRDVIADEGTIKFDWLPSNDFAGGFVKLHSTNCLSFSGTAKVTDDIKEIKITACLYKNEEGLLLKGIWIEEGNYYTWIAEMTHSKN